jgi:hypothetical protein
VPALLRAALVALLALTAVSCSDVTNEVISQHGGPASGGGARDGSARDSQVDGDAAAALAHACDGHPCQCNDGEDEDGDGLIDGLDPECTGPFDDDEDSFGTGHPSIVAACQDCFWDDNELQSDDTCNYPSTCTLVSGGVSDPACSGCGVAPECIDHCRPSTPNGCDCFGCCEVTTKTGSVVNVVLAEGCSVRNADDPQACPRCYTSGNCRNPCGTCELCLGRKRRDLPQSCRGHPNEDPTPTCDDGELTCSDTEPCPFPYYCQLGCCLVKVI